MHLETPETPASASPAELAAQEADALFADRTINGVLLDRSGKIVYVSPGWKQFAAEAGLSLPDFGVGQNYLRHCAFADQESARIIEDISHLLAGRIDCLSFIYPCHGQVERRWFLLLGFPRVKGELTALLHLDITSFMPHTEKRDPVILTEKLGAGPFAPPDTKCSAEDRPGLRETPSAEYGPGVRGGTSAPLLSRRQREVLELMAKGMSNIEIARALAISPNTVKIHVSGILARLGLPSRAQAIHWSLTRALRDRSHP